MILDAYFDEDFDADEESVARYIRISKDERTPAIIDQLKLKKFDDLEIRILFRVVAQIPRNWEREKEAPDLAEKRRTEMAAKLRALLPAIEADPDLSHLYFGTEVGPEGQIITIVSVDDFEPEPEFISFVTCINDGLGVLEGTLSAATSNSDACTFHKRELSLKRFAIRSIAAWLEKEKKRAPNIITAAIVSLLLDESCTANDVTQARKDLRRQYTIE